MSPASGHSGSRSAPDETAFRHPGWPQIFKHRAELGRSAELGRFRTDSGRNPEFAENRRQPRRLGPRPAHISRVIRRCRAKFGRSRARCRAKQAVQKSKSGQLRGRCHGPTPVSTSGQDGPVSNEFGCGVGRVSLGGGISVGFRTIGCRNRPCQTSNLDERRCNRQCFTPRSRSLQQVLPAAPMLTKSEPCEIWTNEAQIRPNLAKCSPPPPAPPDLDGL